jgi:hypothetical protein
METRMKRLAYILNYRKIIPKAEGEARSGLLLGVTPLCLAGRGFA